MNKDLISYFHSTHPSGSMALAPEPNIIIVPGSSLPTQPWWKALHSTINASFQNKDEIQAFPPTWTRLPVDAKEGAERLRDELGPEGITAVVLLVDRPIACAGVLPFRGLNWIKNEKSIEENAPHPSEAGQLIVETGEISTDGPGGSNPSLESKEGDYEICCLCIHPLHRKIGLSHKILQALENALLPLGARRLFANYVIEESGRYWPKMGFETIPGAGGVLKKGFTHTKGMEALREDLHFAMGVKDLQR